MGFLSHHQRPRQAAKRTSASTLSSSRRRLANYFLAAATSSFFWHASSTICLARLCLFSLPICRIFIVTTLSRAAAEANHYLSKTIKSNEIAPREQRLEKNRLANQILKRPLLQQQTFFYNLNFQSEGGFSITIWEKQLIICAFSVWLWGLQPPDSFYW